MLYYSVRFLSKLKEKNLKDTHYVLIFSFSPIPSSQTAGKYQQSPCFTLSAALSEDILLNIFSLRQSKVSNLIFFSPNFTLLGPLYSFSFCSFFVSSLLLSQERSKKIIYSSPVNSLSRVVIAGENRGSYRINQSTISKVKS